VGERRGAYRVWWKIVKGKRPPGKARHMILKWV
jgi:hypothetical protein